MAPAVPIAVGATLIFALATIPAFIIIEVLLPLADGFAMFALAVAPMLFLCAFLMAHKKTMLIGYLSALLFASAGLFQNRMVYDPAGMLNTCIAAIVAAATAMVLWATSHQRHRKRHAAVLSAPRGGHWQGLQHRAGVSDWPNSRQQ
jgi:uncharacterized membrane protein YccC